MLLDIVAIGFNAVAAIAGFWLAGVSLIEVLKTDKEDTQTLKDMLVQGLVGLALILSSMPYTICS